MLKVTIDECFIGIDESNMGRFPEFHVAVSSRDLSEGIVRKKKLIKYKKDNSMYCMEDLLSDTGFNYNFLLISEAIKDQYAPSFLKSHIIANLIPSLKLDPKSIKRVFIDGSGKSIRKDEIVEMLKRDFNFEFIRSKIEFKREADELIEVVNITDAVAYYLFQQYKRDKRNLLKYEGHMIKLALPSVRGQKQRYANKPSNVRMNR